VILKRPLTPEESRFIENERLVCRFDFRYWLQRYAWVRSWKAMESLVQVIPNIAQEMTMDIWADLEEQGVSIEILQLKARQLGVSTFTELAIQHRTQFYSYVNAVVASASPDQSEKMSDMIVRCLQRQPWWLSPVCTAFRERELIEFGRFNSGISIQHGSQFNGIGRGTTPTVVHLSEVASFIKPEAIIDAALLRAVHPAPGVFMVFESTAEGRGNWLHLTWQHAVTAYPRHEARLCPMFLPWFVGADKYPSPEWLHKRPIPLGWQPNENTLHHAEKARQFVQNDLLLKRYMPADWEMSVAQQWFYQCEYNEYKAKKELATFKQEMPANPEEAFQSTGFSAFDAEVISEYENMARPPIGVYGVVAKPMIVPLDLQPTAREADPNKPPIDIRPLTPEGISQGVRVRLVPLRYDSLSTLDPNNKVLIWEMPERRYEYGLGEDIAEGLGADRTVIEVLRRGSSYHTIKQVCEFASDQANAVAVTGIAYALGCFYSPNSESLARHTIEVNTGEPLQLELRKLGWSNFHRWCRYDSRKLTPSNKLGWVTVGWSRWLMLDYLVHFLRGHLIEINSPWFIEEMQTFQKADADAKLKAEYGAHDDRIMALGINFFSMHIWDFMFRMGTVSAGESDLGALYRSVVERQDDESLPVYMPAIHAPSTYLWTPEDN
ncbi:MAG: hypothetical protein ACRD22_12185, partial [Terriglobia bacterium]